MNDQPLPSCRSCGSNNLIPFLDLGKTPLADALVKPENVGAAEDVFPLEVAMCPDCALVQILEEVPEEKLFVENYLYFSSFSQHLLDHSRDHALNLIATRGLGAESLVVELASNDGYLLKNFVEHGIPVLGIDPAPDQAAAANAAGVPTMAEFFGIALAEKLCADGKQADVIIANNVMAHVPDLNGFVAGMARLIKPGGLITVENPYVRDLIEHCEFDTIYHEHFCYYSCHAVKNLVNRHGLYLNDVEYFPDLHGGTLRWHIQPVDAPTERITQFLADEVASGMTVPAFYLDFGGRVERLRSDLRSLLQSIKSEGGVIAAYGAAAKGSTLLNYAELGTDLIDFVVDRNTHKQGLHMPGTHQPIASPELLIERRPDYVLLLAWNFATEILAQQSEYRRLGGRFIVPVPTPQVLA